jgi:hypothetical protein
MPAIAVLVYAYSTRSRFTRLWPALVLTLVLNTDRSCACAQVGYQVEFVKFVVFFALMFLMLLISETLGILCAGFHRTELVGLIILSVFYLPLLMFTGFIQVCCRSCCARMQAQNQAVGVCYRRTGSVNMHVCWNAAWCRSCLRDRLEAWLHRDSHAMHAHGSACAHARQALQARER